MQSQLSYPESVIQPLRFQFCPMCATQLTREVIFDDNIPRIKCPACGWIQLSSNAVAVVVVARNEQGIAVIFPPNETGIGLPAGLVEYGEDPAEAAVREVLEETGLEAKIVDCLGWAFIKRTTWPGPMVQIMYEAEITGGQIKGSDEGPAKLVPLSELPPVSSTRTGSQKALQAYRTKNLPVSPREKGRVIVTDDELVQKTQAYLDEQEAVDKFSGAVLIAHQQQPVLKTARGYAIQPEILRNKPDTKFNVASVTKMFTAIGVMQLVAQGKLDLHVPVARYNADLPHADHITVHQLLTHTAGFDRYWNNAYRAARSDLRTIADYLKLFANTPLEFPPGTRPHYGNAGYVILGALIEKVSGGSYYEYMNREVFQPAGMQDTDFYEMDLPLANCAMGYTRENWFSPADGKQRSNQFIYAVKGSPAEHCFSTVEDIFRFFQALQNNRLLDNHHQELCFIPHAAGEQAGVSYGYGFHLIDDGQHGRLIGHGGRAMGGDAFAVRYDLGYTVIILSNYDRPAARAVLNYIADLLIS